MALRIYKVTDIKGGRSLVKAHTSNGALNFKRAQIILEAEIASQDDLVSLVKDGVPVESVDDDPAT